MGKPITKNCPFCGRFMELAWMASDHPNLPPNLRTNEEDWVPVFICLNDSCPNGLWRKDGIYIDPERLLDFYRFKIYEDPEYLEAAKIDAPEMLPELLAEREEMVRLYENRPYQAIPSLDYV